MEKSYLVYQRVLVLICGLGILMAGCDSNGGGIPTPIPAIPRDEAPAVSPDGSQITYDRSLADEKGPGGVWTMTDDGLDRRPLCGAGSPNWHPQGDKLIAIQGRPDQSFEFVECELNDGHESPLPPLPIYSLSNLQYSPDGSRFVYKTSAGIWIAASDGSWAHRILPDHRSEANDRTPRLAVGGGPSWHPDGEHIVYEHLRIDHYDFRDYGAEIDGEWTLRLLDVDAALAVAAHRT